MEIIVKMYVLLISTMKIMILGNVAIVPLNAKNAN